MLSDTHQVEEARAGKEGIRMSHEANMPAFLPIRRIPLRSATETLHLYQQPKREPRAHRKGTGSTCKLQMVPSETCQYLLTQNTTLVLGKTETE